MFVCVWLCMCIRGILRQIYQAGTLTFFSFKNVIDGKKMTYASFEIFLKIYLAVMVQIFDYTINSLIKKNIRDC